MANNTHRKHPPEGFEQIDSRGPFSDLIGPIFRKKSTLQDTREFEFGFLPTNSHTNLLGLVQGGLISSLADIFMAQSIAQLHKCRLVTLNLDIEFIHAMTANRWIDGKVTLEPLIGEELSARVMLSARGRKCAKANGKFKIFR